MDLRNLFHRRDLDLLPLTEEEWAPIAAALRAMPDIPAPRDFRLTEAQAERLRHRPWRERFALPAPVAGGLVAVLVLAIVAPSFLGGQGGAAPGPAFEAADTTITTGPDNRDGGSYFGTSSAPGVVTIPKAVDACLPTPTPDPFATPNPTPTPDPSATPAPTPSCDPAP